MATHNDYGSPTDTLNAPSHSAWAAAVAVSLNTVLSDSVPVGTIFGYGGNVAPTGWAICDGTAHGSTALEAVIGSANTPDLRGRFILAASGTYPVNSVGGESDHAVSITELPAHRHRISLEYGGGPGDPAQPHPGQYNQVRAASGYVFYDQPMEDTGGSATHNNMPPYYVLIYIVKT